MNWEEENSISLAERLFIGDRARRIIEDKIDTLFYEYENIIPNYYISCDDYDNSIEIYFEDVLPYPYEPCKEIRKGIVNMGFHIVYWNFIDENGEYTEEIRGNEPRRYKDYLHVYVKNVGYVDNRYFEKS